MNTDELMIGDWVCYSDYNTPTQIKSIDEYVYIENSINRCWLSDRQIRPIPITKENLKLNGLVRSTEYDRCDYIRWFDSQLIVMCFDRGTIRAEIVHNKKDRQFEGTINYVHELQHALRLCGMTELADNWRVE